MPGIAHARQRPAPMKAGATQGAHLEDGAVARPDADKVIGGFALGEKDRRRPGERRVLDDPRLRERRMREQADVLKAARNRATDPARRRLVKRHEPLRDFLRLTDEDHFGLSNSAAS